MATPTLITVPDRCADSVVMTLRRAVGMTASPFTFEEQVFDWGGEQWYIDFSIPPTTSRAVAAEWQSFGLKAKGRFNYFLLGDPAGKIPRGVATGTPLVKGGSQTGNTLITDGWTPDTSNIMRQGDYFQIGTGSLARLYMIVEDVNSNSSGDATLTFHPALRYSPADNAPLVVNNAKGLFRMMENDFAWSAGVGNVYRFSLQAVEVLNA